MQEASAVCIPQRKTGCCGCCRSRLFVLPPLVAALDLCVAMRWCPAASTLGHAAAHALVGLVCVHELDWAPPTSSMTGPAVVARPPHGVTAGLSLVCVSGCVGLDVPQVLRTTTSTPTVTAQQLLLEVVGVVSTGQLFLSHAGGHLDVSVRPVCLLGLHCRAGHGLAVVWHLATAVCAVLQSVFRGTVRSPVHVDSSTW